MIGVGEACVLGAVQGLTEFLPVSSSGHLALTHQMIAPLSASETVAVDVALHLGTLGATIAYFHRDLLGMASALAQPGRAGWHWRWIWLLALASLPVAVVGGLWRGPIEATFTSMPVVGFNFLVTGTVLFLADRVADRVRASARGEADVTWRDALVVGACQAAALLPGISRSGATISGGLFRRLRPDVAARFSFLLGLPAVAGAEVLELPKLVALDAAGARAVAAGAVVAGVTGFAAIWSLLKLLAAGRLDYFAYYLWPLGTLVLLASWGRGG